MELLHPEALSCLPGDPHRLYQGKPSPGSSAGAPMGGCWWSFIFGQCCECPCLSLCSKPPGGTGWPSRRGRGCCSEHAGASHAGSLSCCRCQPRRDPLSLDRADSTASGCFPRGSFQPLCKLLTGKESNFNGSSASKQLLPSLS